MSKIIIESWDNIFPEGGCSYSIYENDTPGPTGGKFAISVTMFLKEATGKPEDDQVIDIPLQRSFKTAQEAFDWIEREDPFIGLTSPEVYVIGKNGEIITEWTMDCSTYT